MNIFLSHSHSKKYLEPSPLIQCPQLPQTKNYKDLSHCLYVSSNLFNIICLSFSFSYRFLEICNTTFEVYIRWNSGKISSIPQDAEEEAYEVCYLLLPLIDNIGS